MLTLWSTQALSVFYAYIFLRKTELNLLDFTQHILEASFEVKLPTYGNKVAAGSPSKQEEMSS